MVYYNKTVSTEALVAGARRLAMFTMLLDDAQCPWTHVMELKT